MKTGDFTIDLFELKWYGALTEHFVHDIPALTARILLYYRKPPQLPRTLDTIYSFESPHLDV